MRKILSLVLALVASTSIHAADGVVPGKFTINADGDQVQFAQGNLQAIGTGDSCTWTWRFAENQWDYAGKENNRNNILLKPNSAGFPGAVYDLFGWSTDQTYYGLNLSTSNSDYSGEFVDWGNLMGEGWRTLTYDEWDYILRKRENALDLRGIGRVYDGVSEYINGLILLPDGADKKTLGFTSNATNWSDNSLSPDSKVMKAGAVFLPAAGIRGLYYTQSGDLVGIDVIQVSNTCYYWASTPYGEENASALYVTQGHLKVNKFEDRWCGYSVRLVRAAPIETAIEDVKSSSLQGGERPVDGRIEKDRGRLVILNGQIFIQRGEKIYTLQGQEVQ